MAGRGTDDPLLVKKAYREVLESIDVRISAVRGFLELFKRGVQYDIVPIADVYGPTASDPNIQALIVSKETVSGANASELIQISCETYQVYTRHAYGGQFAFRYGMGVLVSNQRLTFNSFVVCSCKSEGGKVAAGLEDVCY